MLAAVSSDYCTSFDSSKSEITTLLLESLHFKNGEWTLSVRSCGISTDVEGPIFVHCNLATYGIFGLGSANFVACIGGDDNFGTNSVYSTVDCLEGKYDYIIVRFTDAKERPVASSSCFAVLELIRKK
jgi:hypothetical protein